MASKKHLDLRRGGRRMYLVPAAAALDQLCKVAAGRITDPVGIPGLITLISPVYNTGAAFSLGRGSGWILTLLTGLLILGICAWMLLRPEVGGMERFGLLLCAGGGLGNLIDRLARGAVTDFIQWELFDFPIFNVGDICVCVGVALAILGILLEDRRVRHGGV